MKLKEDFQENNMFEKISDIDEVVYNNFIKYHYNSLPVDLLYRYLETWIMSLSNVEELRLNFSSRRLLLKEWGKIWYIKKKVN